MDEKLVAWARAVKARHRISHPVLWLFTDETRLRNPVAAIARLPKNLCGVVFRHDGAPDRLALAHTVARLCRAKKIPLTIAGDWRLAAALQAGQHFRGASGPRRIKTRLATSSAHTLPDLRRAARLGALPFLSPVFPTPSHPGARTLGAWRFAALAHRRRVLGLGGIDGSNAGRLSCHGVGAITVFLG